MGMGYNFTRCMAIPNSKLNFGSYEPNNGVAQKLGGQGQYRISRENILVSAEIWKNTQHRSYSRRVELSGMGKVFRFYISSSSYSFYRSGLISDLHRKLVRLILITLMSP